MSPSPPPVTTSFSHTASRQRRVSSRWVALPAFANSQSQCPTVKNLVRAGETIFSTKYERRAGGKGANQAVAIAKAGGRVDLLGSVGEDGIWLIQYLQAIGVNTDNVSVVEVSTVESVWFLSHDFEKRRHIQGAL